AEKQEIAELLKHGSSPAARRGLVGETRATPPAIASGRAGRNGRAGAFSRRPDDRAVPLDRRRVLRRASFLRPPSVPLPRAGDPRGPRRGARFERAVRAP